MREEALSTRIAAALAAPRVVLTKRPVLRRLALPLAGLLLLGMALVIRHAGGPEKESLPDGDKPPRPVTFSGRSSWDESRLGLYIEGVEFLGATAIVVGGRFLSDRTRLAVVDVRTGTPHWALDTQDPSKELPGEPLKGGDGATAHDGGVGGLLGSSGKPVHIGAGDDSTVFVQYVIGGEAEETERGVAALSGADGSVRWKSPLIRPRSGPKGRSNPRQRVNVPAADSHVVLVNMGSSTARGQTVALDTASGRKLWERDDDWAYQITGNVVLGQPSTDRSRRPWEEEGPHDGENVIALDAGTGKKKWGFDDRYQASHLQATAGGLAVIRAEEMGQAGSRGATRTLVVDTATGQVKGILPENLYNCGSDGRDLIACVETSDPELVTIRASAHSRPAVAKKRLFGDRLYSRLSIDAVWEDRIFVSGTRRADETTLFAMVDRAGNRLASWLPGRAIALSDHHAAFFVRPSNGDPHRFADLAVHSTHED
ncbi:outer membrane protein assembly factor BamB family protein [Actinomadura rudentiformis]|uniref:PQQ-binding-like beta-propeller repeat protein n=1 Tax=Actinomadura rudentiformis TaxID=359158 RepID=A0A6H9YNM0_9ACTN|nr:PQQ-binding-like beta-propeller repeat protein [Actinomadura rudentiformis]KAB2344132.1 PQQ-binding-like beta-propeller repeat protein [Actinomadura rudentiformis]